MKILIITQKVDQADPVLGFFHRWIEEFSKHFEKVSVICLEEGKHNLPPHVAVYSLGKEKRHSRLNYVLNFYRLMWKLRHDYEVVFVHMNEEYVMLGGLLWRILGRCIVFERNHKMGTWMTPIACSIANVVDYTSPNSFSARYPNAVRTPIGIDTNFFSPDENPAQPSSVLFLGRTDPVKRVDVFLEAMHLLERDGVNVHADIYGDPSTGSEAYMSALKEKYADLSNVSFYSGVPNAQTPQLYRSHMVYVNITPSGSFDKTIGEAMACGAVVVCMNDAVREVLPDSFMVGQTAESTAQAIRNALAMNPDERRALVEKCRAWVLREHSLKLLGEWLSKIY